MEMIQRIPIYNLPGMARHEVEKMRNVSIIGLVICLLLIAPAYANSTDNITSITASRAMLTQLNLSEKMTYTGSEDTSRGYYNKFSADDGSEYFVNRDTYALEKITVPIRGKNTAAIKLTPDNAQKAAQVYVDKYSKNQNRPNLNNVTTRLIDHGFYKEYLVEFTQVENGIILPNAAAVSIDPSDGSLLYYISVNQKPVISLKPQISRDEAIRIASQQYPKSPVKQFEGVLQVANLTKFDQKLIWSVKLTCEPVDQTPYGGFLVIDANDGKILHNGSFL
jgi:Zn-dependent metalloprotease